MAPALGVTLLGFGSALFVWGGRVAVASAGASMLAGALLTAPAIVSADTLAASATLSRSTADASEIARIPVSTNVFSVDLFPEGRWLVIRHYDSPGRPDANRYTLRSLDGVSRELTGVQFAFADDDRVLVLRRAGDSLSLQLERVDSGIAVWSVALPPMFEVAGVAARPRVVHRRTRTTKPTRWSLSPAASIPPTSPSAT